MLNRAHTPDLSYHPRRSVEPQMKTIFDEDCDEENV